MVKVKDPKITLDVEALMFPEQGTGPQSFAEWMTTALVKGDDGNEYQLGPCLMTMKKEKIDINMLWFSTEKAKIYPLPNSIYKVAEI